MKISSFCDLEFFARKKGFGVIERRYGVFREVLVFSPGVEGCSIFTGKRRYQNAANYIVGCLEAEK
ncbi:hypothetical protein [Agarilytica rhodophyticola]|uniref:hypothetical protein n=1 Tax=Agarilytica rhodophyticola TaxID=1737490 RepID=UPI000B344CAC|nr:hypothetical protein [Agarilytica rhodophyticola]